MNDINNLNFIQNLNEQCEHNFENVSSSEQEMKEARKCVGQTYDENNMAGHFGFLRH